MGKTRYEYCFKILTSMILQGYLLHTFGCKDIYYILLKNYWNNDFITFIY